MNLQRVLDVAKDKQSDAFKQEIYEDIQSFVYKYHTRYYPHYKGELSDLVVEFYADFMRPKKHRNGEVYSEMDRFEPDKLGGSDWTADDSKKLAAYIQRFVWHRLIDRERTDKREVNYSETYNEETGDLSLDYLAKLIDEQDPGIDELVFTPKLVSQAKEAYANMPNDKKKEFLKLYESLKSTLPENMSTLLSEVVGEDTSADIKSAPKSKASSSEVTEVIPDIKSAVGNVQVDSYKLKGMGAVRVLFENKEDAKGADRSNVDSILGNLGYEFYRAVGNAWYYLKK